MGEACTFLSLTSGFLLNEESTGSQGHLRQAHYFCTLPGPVGCIGFWTACSGKGCAFFNSHKYSCPKNPFKEVPNYGRGRSLSYYRLHLCLEGEESSRAMTANLPPPNLESSQRLMQGAKETFCRGGALFFPASQAYVCRFRLPST